MDFSQIKEVVKRRGFTVKALCEYVGLTENGFKYAIRKKTLKVSDLEKISNFLGVSMTYWYHNDQDVDDSHVSEPQDVYIKTDSIRKIASNGYENEVERSSILLDIKRINKKLDELSSDLKTLRQKDSTDKTDTL